MLLRTPLVLLLSAATTHFARAHRIEVDPGQKECFYEMLQPRDRMTVTYEVGGSLGGGQLDIDFFVTEPAGEVVHTSHRKSQGSFEMEAHRTGRYTYCFGNEMSTYARKILSFNVHGVLYVEDDEKVAPIDQEIRQLASSLQLVKDEQAYLVVRERVHRDTCESTNSRVKWWGITQVFIVIGVFYWNVRYLKSWFEVKRVL